VGSILFEALNEFASLSNANEFVPCRSNTFLIVLRHRQVADDACFVARKNRVIEIQSDQLECDGSHRDSTTASALQRAYGPSTSFANATRMGAAEAALHCHESLRLNDQETGAQGVEDCILHEHHAPADLAIFLREAECSKKCVAR
jgi:hypothetical protein